MSNIFTLNVCVCVCECVCGTYDLLPWECIEPFYLLTLHEYSIHSVWINPYLLHLVLAFSRTFTRTLSGARCARHCSIQSSAGEYRVRKRGNSSFCTARRFCTLSPCIYKQPDVLFCAQTPLTAQTHSQQEGLSVEGQWPAFKQVRRRGFLYGVKAGGAVTVC